ncbi:hypothetical protein ACOME3_005497 [Neoechinorhynchus agilis]
MFDLKWNTDGLISMRYLNVSYPSMRPVISVCQLRPMNKKDDTEFLELKVSQLSTSLSIPRLPEKPGKSQIEEFSFSDWDISDEDPEKSEKARSLLKAIHYIKCHKSNDIGTIVVGITDCEMFMFELEAGKSVVSLNKVNCEESGSHMLSLDVKQTSNAEYIVTGDALDVITFYKCRFSKTEVDNSKSESFCRLCLMGETYERFWLTAFQLIGNSGEAMIAGDCHKNFIAMFPSGVLNNQSGGNRRIIRVKSRFHIGDLVNTFVMGVHPTLHLYDSNNAPFYAALVSGGILKVQCLSDEQFEILRSFQVHIEDCIKQSSAKFAVGGELERLVDQLGLYAFNDNSKFRRTAQSKDTNDNPNVFVDLDFLNSFLNLDDNWRQKLLGDADCVKSALKQRDEYKQILK